MSLTFVIADLHGRYDLLVKAEQAIKDYSRGMPGTIVTLGDYVDRGPESKQIVTRLMCGVAPPWKLICLKGNHEDMMVETLRGPLDQAWWVGNGGETTLRSYLGSVPEDHLDWIAALPRVYTDKHRVYVHAGVSESIPLDEQTEAMLLWFRYPEDADVGYGGYHVVHGHTPHVDGPKLLQRRSNLDTLAWHTGRLTVGVFDDDVAGGPVDLIEVKAPPASFERARC
jgi:serine/threonine protein phosphatase 1